MKNRNILITISLLLGLVVMMSCSENSKVGNEIKIPEEGLPVYATLDTRALPAGLNCHMYVFSKALTGTTYTYNQTIDLSGTPPHQIQFEPHGISGKEFRFLFVAQPATDSKISVVTATDWEGFRITTTDKEMGEDYYYGILNKTGTEIVNEGNLHGILKRMVGQMVLDIYKIDGNINNPVEIDPFKKITSVLDRVHEIEIDYSNLTKEISFDSNGDIKEESRWDTPFNQIIHPVLGDTLQVTLPQVENGLLVSGTGLNGSVRIKGPYGLASTSKVRVKYTFKYYDTTPINEIYGHQHGRECYGMRVSTICGFKYLEQHEHGPDCFTDGILTCDKVVHVHTVDCYPADVLPTCGFDVHIHDKDCFESDHAIILNLPEETENTELLSIIPNKFTVNKAGIRMNRIIDLNQPGSFNFETIWENEKIK